MSQGTLKNTTCGTESEKEANKMFHGMFGELFLIKNYKIPIQKIIKQLSQKNMVFDAKTFQQSMPKLVTEKNMEII